MDKCELIDIFWPNLNNTINTNRLSLPLRTLLLLPGAYIVPHLTVQVKDCKKYKRLHYSLQSEVQQNRMNFLTIGSEPSAQVGVDSSAQGGRLKIFSHSISCDWWKVAWVDIALIRTCRLTIYRPVLPCGVVVGLVPIGAVGESEVVAEVTSGCGQCK